MATDAQIKQINALIKKYPDSCSICQQDYDEDYVTYTVFGYDKNRKMQVTTGCCARTLTELVLLGVCGCFDPDERDEIMKITQWRRSSSQTKYWKIIAQARNLRAFSCAAVKGCYGKYSLFRLVFDTNGRSLFEKSFSVFGVMSAYLNLIAIFSRHNKSLITISFDVSNKDTCEGRQVFD